MLSRTVDHARSRGFTDATDSRRLLPCPLVGVEPTGTSPRCPAGGGQPPVAIAKVTFHVKHQVAQLPICSRAPVDHARSWGSTDATDSSRLLPCPSSASNQRVHHPGAQREGGGLPPVAPVVDPRARRAPPIRLARDGCSHTPQSASGSTRRSPRPQQEGVTTIHRARSDLKGDVSRETSGCSVAELLSRTSRSRAHRDPPIRPIRDGCCRALSSASSSTGASPRPRGGASFRSIVLPKRRPLSMVAGNSRREGYFDAETRRTNVARGSGRANAEAVSTTARLHHARTGAGGPGRSTDDTSPPQRSFATATRPGQPPEVSVRHREAGYRRVPDLGGLLAARFAMASLFAGSPGEVEGLRKPRLPWRSRNGRGGRYRWGSPFCAADVSRETRVQPVARGANPRSSRPPPALTPRHLDRQPGTRNTSPPHRDPTVSSADP